MNGSDIQIDGGNYTRIHNAILEVLACTKLPAVELRAVLYLLPMTYGWRCKEAEISINEWAKAISIKPVNVPRVLQSLEAKHIINRHQTGKRRANVWSFNKYIEQWVIDGDTITSDSISSDNVDTIKADSIDTITGDNESTITGDSPIKKERNTKKRIKKDTSSPSADDATAKPKRQKPPPHPNTKPILDAYQEAIDEYEPGAKLNYGQEGTAAKDLAKLGHSPENIVACYRWLKLDPFYERQHVSLHTVGKQIGAYRAQLERKELMNGTGPNRPDHNGFSSAEEERAFATRFREHQQRIAEQATGTGTSH